MKILAIASAGGHWVQLLRVRPSFETHETTYISTKPGFDKLVEGSAFYLVADSNRKDIKGLYKSFFSIYKIINKVRPDIIITTGASPGLMGLFAGKIIGCRTVWIDSIANVKELSMSGRLALYFADRVYTQWPDLATKDVLFNGNVLG